MIPTPAFSVAEPVTIEVQRAPGLTARRSEIDGFAGTMTRLRAVYDALQQCSPVVFAPPDALIDTMQTGDRIGYHPETAVDEITHLHDQLPQAQAAVAALGTTFSQKLDAYAARMEKNPYRPVNMDWQKQTRLDDMTRAEQLVNEAGK